MARITDVHSLDLEHGIQAIGLGFARFRVADAVLQVPLVEGLLAAAAERQDLLLFVAILQLFLQVGVGPGCDSVAPFDRIALVELEFVARAVLLVGELAVERTHVPASFAGGSIVEVRGHAEPFPVDRVVPLFDLFRALELDAVLALEVVEPSTVGFYVLGPEVAVVPRHRRRDAEVVLALTESEGVRVDERELRTRLVLQRVCAGVQVGAQFSAGGIEGGGALDVDRAADAVPVHVGGDRLAHLQRRQQLRRNDVECHRALVVFRRRHVDAVDRGDDEVGVYAADADEPPLPLVPLQEHARDALQRLRDVPVGKLADIGRRNDGNDAIRRTLLVERRRSARGLLAVDDHFLERFLEGHGMEGRLIVPYVDGGGVGRISDVVDGQVVAARRDGWEYEAAIPLQ